MNAVANSSWVSRNYGLIPIQALQTMAQGLWPKVHLWTTEPGDLDLSALTKGVVEFRESMQAKTLQDNRSGNHRQKSNC